MLNVFFKFIRLVKVDFLSESFRFKAVCSIVNKFPGESGSYLRTVILSKYIGSVGKNTSFFGDVTIIHPESLLLGNNVLFNKDIYIQASGGVDIDDYTIFGPSVKIWSLNHVFSDPEIWIPEQGYDYAPVKIGKYVWIGANVFIMPGATISDYTIVSAGSVVGAKRFPPGAILAGNPARRIGKRPLPH